MELAERFYALFMGNERAHGVFNVKAERERDGKKQGTATVIKEPTTVEHWVAHLNGENGLGIVPIKDTQSCVWGAIDVDVYSVDHKYLCSKLKKAGLPGVVCRSKSGGAHLYFFFTEDVSAEDLQPKLAEIAAMLGYAGCELFPKQTKILVDRGDTGNFLNMPYFAGERTTRYAFDEDGTSLGVEEFLDFAEARRIAPDDFLDIKTEAEKAAAILPHGPPCLQHLCAQGFGEGGRNNALFNLGVYARLAHKEGWEDVLQKYNTDFMHPPLPAGEVAAVIKQLQKKDYFYKCDDQPIVGHCNKALCLTRKFGVGPGQRNSDLSSLTKINGDPPIWLLNVDGKRVELSTDALHSQFMFQKECLSQINAFPVAVSNKAWQARVQELLGKLTVIEVPPEATLRGAFEDLLTSFCCDRARGTERQDILQGIAVWTEGRVYFLMKDLMKHLQVNNFTTYSLNRVGFRLRELGADKMYWKDVRGKGVHVWYFPVDFFSSHEEKVLDLPERVDREAVL